MRSGDLTPRSKTLQSSRSSSARLELTAEQKERGRQKVTGFL